MPRAQYTVLVEWDPAEQCWVGTVPALNWLSDFGETEEQLRERIEEAVEGYLEVLRDHGDPIPQGDPPGPLVPPWRRRATAVEVARGSVSLRFAPA